MRVTDVGTVPGSVLKAKINGHTVDVKAGVNPMLNLRNASPQAVESKFLNLLEKPRQHDQTFTRSYFVLKCIFASIDPDSVSCRIESCYV